MWPWWRPSNTPTTTNTRPVILPKRRDARRRPSSHSSGEAGSGSLVRDGSCSEAAAASQLIVGAPRLPRAPCPARAGRRCRARSRPGAPSGVEQPDATRALGQPGHGRMSWPRVTAVSSSAVRVSAGTASRPAVDRPQELRQRTGSGRRGRAQAVVLERDGLEAERPARGPDQRPQVGRADPTAAPRSRASARTYVPAEHSTSTTATGRSGSVSSQRPSSIRWIVTSRGASSRRLAGACERVRTPAADAGSRCRRAALDDRRRETPRALRPRPLPSGGGPAGRRRARLRGRRSSTWRRSRPSPGRPSGRRGGTRRAASRDPGRSAGPRSRTGRGSRRGRRAASPPGDGRARPRRGRSGRRAWRRPGCRPARPSRARAQRRTSAISVACLGEDRGPRLVERQQRPSRRRLARDRPRRTRRSAPSRPRRRAWSGR